ncbi:hypothetical protein [Massilia glaciei]|uniref:Uncharacterized protein n=1 Tax=Massilia glaciei TaxID=1524097 RepID=A0A2U2I6C9_9BURK|nr:hypothetical protein [Massilia glaciei]PWF55225.1 hypothetical protein C7C56_002885 [Massilia glaciei]
MKLLRIIFGFATGIVLAALVCWGGLFAYEVFLARALGREGSLFTTNPQAANAFFVTWAVVSLIAALGGTRIAGAGRRDRPRNR